VEILALKDPAEMSELKPTGLDPSQKKPGGKSLKDVHDAKNHATGKAGEVARNAAFAGIAVIWLITGEGHGAITGALLFALVFLSAALVVDFAQYVYCSFIWSKFYRETYAIYGTDDELVDIPENLTAKAYGFFWLKIIIFALGFFCLLVGAFSRIKVF
jgi:hypothetical protein